MPKALLKFTSVPVTSVYGWRILKKTKQRNHHDGADTANGSKYPHSAFGDGIVVESPQLFKHWKYGWFIRIKHADGIETSHHSLDKKALFKVGQRVRMGDIIGYAGASALAASGAHVHNALWLDGKHVDPLKYLTPGVAVTVSLRELEPVKSGTPVAIPVTAPVEPAPVVDEVEDFDMSQIRYFHRVEPKYATEWMIAGMELPGGFRTTSDKATAEVWGALYGTAEGDSWRALSRDQYIRMQAEAKSLNVAYVAQQKAMR